MPAPLAAIPTVAAFLGRHGVTKAIKKYGKKAVDEARKHSKDLTTKKTTGQKKIEPVTKSQRATRSTARRTAAVAGPVGAAIGAGMSKKKSAGSTKKLPLAKKGVTVDAKGTGKGMRYYQNGKEVRIK